MTNSRFLKRTSLGALVFFAVVSIGTTAPNIISVAQANPNAGQPATPPSLSTEQGGAEVGADNRYKRELDAFFKGIKTKNYDVLKPILSPKVDITNMINFQKGINDEVVPQVLGFLPIPTSYSIKNSVEKDGSTQVNALYKYEGKPESPVSFIFDAQGKITSFNLPGITKIGMRVETHIETRKEAQVATVGSLPKQIKRPNRIEMPFTLVNNIPLVTAEMNGKQEHFLLDSGAGNLTLNSIFLNKAQLKKSDAFAMGVGGTAQLQTFHVNTFNWQGLTWSDFDTLASPMPEQEEEKGEKIIGLIGYEVYKDYEITLDYAHKRLILVRTDSNGHPVQAALHGRKLLDVIPFKIKDYTPVFPMKVAGRAYQMGLDTGAGANLLYAKYVTNLKKAAAFVPGSVSQGDLGGVGANVTTNTVAQMKKAIVGKTPYTKMQFVFEDATLDSLDAVGMKIDGLLGYEFLSQYPTSINFKAGTISVYTKG